MLIHCTKGYIMFDRSIDRFLVLLEFEYGSGVSIFLNKSMTDPAIFYVNIIKEDDNEVYTYVKYEHAKADFAEAVEHYITKAA